MKKNIQYVLCVLLGVIVCAIIQNFLSICGEKTITVKEVNALVEKAKSEAEDKGRIEGIMKSDEKLSIALMEIKKIGTDAARQGNFTSSSNCMIIPVSVYSSKAGTDFPKNVQAMYKAACFQEVVVMSNERKVAEGCKSAEEKTPIKRRYTYVSKNIKKHSKPKNK